MRPERIVSGGQTGVDRAALDAAMEVGIEVGGWCPAGRWAEDGPIDPRYPLRETASGDPADRTRKNVEDSEATLVICMGEPMGGTALTIEIAGEIDRPLLIVDPSSTDATRSAATIRRWLDDLRPRILNVAGPRESERPGIGEQACSLLRCVFER